MSLITFDEFVTENARIAFAAAKAKQSFANDTTKDKLSHEKDIEFRSLESIEQKRFLSAIEAKFSKDKKFFNEVARLLNYKFSDK